MSQTKKVKSTGRFGVRFGVGIRKRVLKIELIQKQRTSCPNCGVGRLRRINRGIFECSKCRAEFAGGTFVPQTLSGRIIKKMVSQKKFVPYTKELIESKEEEKDKKVEEKEEIKDMKKTSEKRKEKKVK